MAMCIVPSRIEDEHSIINPQYLGMLREDGLLLGALGDLVTELDSLLLRVKQSIDHDEALPQALTQGKDMQALCSYATSWGFGELLLECNRLQECARIEGREACGKRFALVAEAHKRLLAALVSFVQEGTIAETSTDNTDGRRVSDHQLQINSSSTQNICIETAQSVSADDKDESKAPCNIVKHSILSHKHLSMLRDDGVLIEALGDLVAELDNLLLSVKQSIDDGEQLSQVLSQGKDMQALCSCATKWGFDEFLSECAQLQECAQNEDREACGKRFALVAEAHKRLLDALVSFIQDSSA